MKFIDLHSYWICPFYLEYLPIKIKRSIIQSLRRWVNGVTVFVDALTTAQFVSNSQTKVPQDHNNHCTNLLFYFHPGLLSYFCGCYQFGKNAEQLGENCLTYALSQFVPLLNLYCRTVVRGRIRDQKGIDGSCFNDLLCVICLPVCALAQESQVTPNGPLQLSCCRSLSLSLSLSLSGSLSPALSLSLSSRNFLKVLKIWQENEQEIAVIIADQLYNYNLFYKCLIPICLFSSFVYWKKKTSEMAREWSSGLFGCFDDCTICKSCGHTGQTDQWIINVWYWI